MLHIVWQFGFNDVMIKKYYLYNKFYKNSYFLTSHKKHYPVVKIFIFLKINVTEICTI